LKVSDADVGKYLKLFTFLRQEEIDNVLQRHSVRPVMSSLVLYLIVLQENPEYRVAQYRLASEVTEMVHQSQSFPSYVSPL